MSAADNEPVMWVDDLVKAVRQKDVEVNKQILKWLLQAGPAD